MIITNVKRRKSGHIVISYTEDEKSSTVILAPHDIVENYKAAQQPPAPAPALPADLSCDVPECKKDGVFHVCADHAAIGPEAAEYIANAEELARLVLKRGAGKLYPQDKLGVKMDRLALLIAPGQEGGES